MAGVIGIENVFPIIGLSRPKAGIIYRGESITKAMNMVTEIPKQASYEDFESRLKTILNSLGPGAYYLRYYAYDANSEDDGNEVKKRETLSRCPALDFVILANNGTVPVIGGNQYPPPAPAQPAVDIAAEIGKAVAHEREIFKYQLEISDLKRKLEDGSTVNPLLIKAMGIFEAMMTAQPQHAIAGPQGYQALTGTYPQPTPQYQPTQTVQPEPMQQPQPLTPEEQAQFDADFYATIQSICQHGFGGNAVAMLNLLKKMDAKVQQNPNSIKLLEAFL